MVAELWTEMQCDPPPRAPAAAGLWPTAARYAPTIAGRSRRYQDGEKWLFARLIPGGPNRVSNTVGAAGRTIHGHIDRSRRQVDVYGGDAVYATDRPFHCADAIRTRHPLDREVEPVHPVRDPGSANRRSGGARSVVREMMAVLDIQLRWMFVLVEDIAVLVRVLVMRGKRHRLRRGARGGASKRVVPQRRGEHRCGEQHDRRSRGRIGAETDIHAAHSAQNANRDRRKHQLMKAVRQ